MYDYSGLPCSGCDVPLNERVNLPEGWAEGNDIPKNLTYHYSIYDGTRFAFRGDPQRQDRVPL